MAEDRHSDQRARAFDSLTTQYLKQALEEQAPAPAVEAVAAESMTLNYVQASLNSAVARPANAQPQSGESKPEKK